MYSSLRRTLLVLILLCSIAGPDLYGQRKSVPVTGRQVLIKTNLPMWLRPEPNLSLEVGLRDNFSLEYRFTKFWPTKSDPNTLLIPTSAFGGGYTMHLMARHHLPRMLRLIVSYGVLFKQWEFTDYPLHREEPDLCHLEDRRATVIGPRFLIGSRRPLFGGRAVLEGFTGLSYKFRIETGTRKQNDQCAQDSPHLGAFKETNQLFGFNWGFNLGIFLNKS